MILSKTYPSFCYIKQNKDDGSIIVANAEELMCCTSSPTVSSAAQLEICVCINL